MTQTRPIREKFQEVPASWPGAPAFFLNFLHRKSLFVSGGGCNGVNEPRTIFRWLYFTGEELRLYRDEKSHHNHMVDGVDQNVPAEVSAAARAYVENELIEAQPNGTWRHKGWQDEGYPQETYDDWRIERISRSCVQAVGDVVIEGWTFNYELHVVDPENVGLAGGKYFTEDNWVSPGYPNCDWLFFRVETEERVFLWHDMINDMSHNSERFQEYPARMWSSPQLFQAHSKLRKSEGKGRLRSLILTVERYPCCTCGLHPRCVGGQYR